MRIAMIGTRGIPATHGGVERAVEELGVRLARRGHRVTVFCRTTYCRERPARHRGMELRYLPAIPTKHLEAASHTFLAALASAFGPYDVVHVHSVGPALFAFLPRLMGKRVVVTVHALDWKRRKWGPLARAALRAGAWSAARFSSATLVVSKAARDYLHDRFGREAYHLPNGVSLPQTSSGKEGARGADQDGPCIVFLGRLVPEKRIEDLIAAFKTLEIAGRLVIAGDGAWSDRYVRELRDLARGDPRILFVGGVYGEDKEGLLDRAAVLVNPSELEGHPIVVLEALAHGLPVLLSDIDAHREILEVDGAGPFLGHTFRTGDHEDLRRGMVRALAMPRDRAARESRRAFAAARFGWESIAAETEKVYLGVAAAAGDPGSSQEPGVVPAALGGPGRLNGDRPC